MLLRSCHFFGPLIMYYLLGGKLLVPEPSQIQALFRQHPKFLQDKQGPGWTASCISVAGVHAPLPHDQSTALAAGVDRIPNIALVTPLSSFGDAQAQNNVSLSVIHKAVQALQDYLHGTSMGCMDVQYTGTVISFSSMPSAHTVRHARTGSRLDWVHLCESNMPLATPGRPSFAGAECTVVLKTPSAAQSLL
jgi:hypothetical protein